MWDIEQRRTTNEQQRHQSGKTYSLVEMKFRRDKKTRAMNESTEKIPGILSNSECDFEFGAQFLNFRHDAVGDIRNAFGIKAVHHWLPNVEFVLNGEVDEIRVHLNFVYEKVKLWTE